MKIENRKIGEIRPYARNPRHIESAVDAVANSIRAFGFRQPIVVDADDVIIIGHVRYAAAHRLGLAVVPVHVAHDLSPEQVRALRIADNKTGEQATWDLGKLAAEITDLESSGVDVVPFGFTVDELAKLFDCGVVEGATDPDGAPVLPEKPTTRPGDLYVLGPHRLLCGDSAAAVDVDRLVDGARVRMANTDPPYNVCVEPRGNSKGRAKDRRLLNDHLAPEDFARKLNAWFYNLSRVLEPGGSFYIWGGYSNLVNYPGPLARAGLYFAQQILWIKNQAVLSRTDYNLQHEWCFYGWREGAAHAFFGPSNSTDVWQMTKVPAVEMVHLTQKPVETAVRAIQNSSRPGDAVLDLFGGSGTTLIACEQTGRVARLMELDPIYCDVIVRRWEEFTGRRAERYVLGAEPKKTEGSKHANQREREARGGSRRASTRRGIKNGARN